MTMGPPSHSRIPAAVRVSARLPVLKASLIPGGKNRGNFSRSSQAFKGVRAGSPRVIIHPGVG